MQYLYLIKCQTFYKIGVANDVESRLAQLSTGNPFELELVDVFGFENAEFVERAIHQRFSGDRIRGEWFEIPNVNIGLFQEICELLGGVRVSSHAGNSSEYEIEQAEEIDVSLENVRTELRMSNGKPIGVVVIERNKERKVVAYIGKTHDEFRKYLELYKQEHPDSKALK